MAKNRAYMAYYEAARPSRLRKTLHVSAGSLDLSVRHGGYQLIKVSMGGANLREPCFGRTFFVDGG
ncbi:MAG: hypothetical protein ABFS56_24210 [Pseudomonadota bacterium]